MNFSKQRATILLGLLFYTPKIFLADPADAKPSSKTVFNLLQVTDFKEKGFIPVTWIKGTNGKGSVAFISNTDAGCNSGTRYLRETVKNAHYVRIMIEGITSYTFGNPLSELHRQPSLYQDFLEKQLGKENVFSVKNVVKIEENDTFLNEKVIILVVRPTALKVKNERANPFN